MYILYDFKCIACEHVQEQLVTSDVRTSVCNKCGSPTSRVISPVRSKLDGLDPGFPDAYDKWSKDHEKRGGVSEEYM